MTTTNTLTEQAAAEMFRSEPSRFLDVGEGQAAYWRVGQGPDVLFVHGWPVSGATWRRLLPRLVDHVTCHVIDLPGAGSSRFTSDTVLTLDQHAMNVRRVVDILELDDVAVVGHDSGGLITRHAMVGDGRLRSMGLIDTEQPQGLGWRFELFLGIRHLPGVGAGLGWVTGQRRLRRTGPSSVAPSLTARSSTGSSTSSSSGRCTTTVNVAMLRCACCATSTNDESTSWERSTAG